MPKEQWETWQKQLFTSFNLRPSFSTVLCANQKAESMKYAHDLVVNHFGCHIWDVRKLSIPLLKSTYFPLSIVYCFYSIYFIIGVIMKFPLQQSEWSWNSHYSSTCCCPHHVVEWACGQAGLKQLLCCQEETAIKGGYSSPIKVMGVLTIPFSGLNLWICGLNLGLIFFLCPLMVDSLHLSLFFLYNFQYVIFFNISKQ